jgi:hypothetical protein
LKIELIFDFKREGVFTLAEKPEKWVQRSSGEQVQLVLHYIRLDRTQVVIDVPSYNARFTFRRKRDWAELLPGSEGRKKINPAKEATLNTSESVYRGMANWAVKILKAKREIRVLMEEVSG